MIGDGDSTQTALLLAALDSIDQGILVYDADLVVVAFNNRVLELLNLPQGQFSVGGPFEDWVRFVAERGSYDPDATVEERIEKRMILARSFAPYRIDQTRPDGEVIEINGRPMSGGAYVTTYTNVTERKEMEKALRDYQAKLERQVVDLRDREERLEAQAAELASVAEELALAERRMKFLANHDALTGLPSLRLCRDRIDQAIAVARRDNVRFALMYVDLDGFKAVNDNLGHMAGDAVLKQVATRLKSCVREIDTVARVGGDEFNILLPKIGHAADAAVLAERLIAALSKDIKISDVTARIGASIGIAVYPTDGMTTEELMKRADQAMYAIKRASKNSYMFATENVLQSTTG